jgi:AcrR family transcriptional regulator
VNDAFTALTAVNDAFPASVAVWLYRNRMPRPADHDQRRAQIARAFQRLLAAEGFAAVSFARVAAEAGVSIGLIQHYFIGKDVLLRFAYDDAVARLSERVRARVREDRAAGLPVAEVLLNSLVELLPLDQERDVEYRVRQGLQAQALHNAGLADVARQAGVGLLGYVTSAVEDGRARGEVAPGVDAALAARMILATVQGLADQVVLSGEFPARDVLRQAITAVFQYGRTATMTV